jgi:hypothetical protein
MITACQAPHVVDLPSSTKLTPQIAAATGSSLGARQCHPLTEPSHWAVRCAFMRFQCPLCTRLRVLFLLRARARVCVCVCVCVWLVEWGGWGGILTLFLRLVYTLPHCHTSPTTCTTAYPATNCIRNGTTFCHTNSGTGMWLQIDLGSQRAIGKVIVINRLDCCQDRIGKLMNTCMLACHRCALHYTLYTNPLSDAPAGSTVCRWRGKGAHG